MKQARALMLVLTLGTTVLSFQAHAVEVEWKETKSDHFILSVQGNAPTSADFVLQYAESYYDEIAHSLGYSRKDQFWLWSNRCRIYLYESKEAFRAATGQNAWSDGFANPQTRAIVSYQGSDKFLNSILPHELAHLILRDFVGGERAIPLWMDEGVAMAQEKERRKEFDQIVKQIIMTRKWIPFETLTRIRSMQSVPTAEAAVFYAEAQSLVRFLLSSGEANRFVQFCRDLRDGTSFERSLQKNYPTGFRSIQELETKWVAANG